MLDFLSVLMFLYKGSSIRFVQFSSVLKVFFNVWRLKLHLTDVHSRQESFNVCIYTLSSSDRVITFVLLTPRYVKDTRHDNCTCHMIHTSGQPALFLRPNKAKQVHSSYHFYRYQISCMTTDNQ